MIRIENIDFSKPKKLEKDKPYIGQECVIKDTFFGEYVEIGFGNNIQESSIDNYSYTAENCQIIYTTIGKFVNIASYVRLNPSPHPMHWASQHHMLYRKEMFGFGEDDESFFDWRRAKKVHVGHDVWLGHNVIVMGGVTIGDGAVIGSGAIVTKDVPPYAICVGNPARVIKYRFDENTREKLQQIAWWDWEHERLHDAIEDFKDIEKFVQKYGK